MNEGGDRDPAANYQNIPQPGSPQSVMQRKGLEIAQRLKETRAKQSQTQIQAKLAIGAVGDKYEQEADRVASQVVQKINAPASVQREPEEEDELQLMPAISSLQREPEEEEEELQMKPDISSIQRHAGHEEEELQAKSLVQRRDTYDGGEASADLESSIQSARSSGQALDPDLQAKMGEVMGADFSGVKVHTDSQSDQLNKSIQAKAFTTGQDLFFRQGTYDPGSRGGQELIAHELTHVVQQNQNVIRREPQAAPQQGTSDMAKLYEEAAEAKKELDPLVKDMAASTGGVAKIPESLKGEARAKEKTATDYGGDASKLLDLARASIVYDSFDKLMDGLAQSSQWMNVVREKNRFTEPTPAGYRDILLNVKLSNGHIAELQLHLEQILQVKSGEGHKLYEQIRTLQAQAETAKRQLTSEEQAKIDKLLAESKKLYDAALSESMETESGA
jgi:hypothetical protein